MSKAKLGDVISVDRFGYQHFGVFSGNNKVVHYHKAEDGRGTVMETSMSQLPHVGGLQLDFSTAFGWLTAALQFLAALMSFDKVGCLKA